VRICVGYYYDGEEIKTAPTEAEAYARCQPIYMQESTVGVSRYEDLPANARTYLEKLENLLEIPIDIVSTGADRNETVIKRHPYD